MSELSLDFEPPDLTHTSLKLTQIKNIDSERNLFSLSDNVIFI